MIFSILKQCPAIHAISFYSNLAVDSHQPKHTVKERKYGLRISSIVFPKRCYLFLISVTFLVRNEMTKIMGIPRGYQPLSFNQNRSHLLKFLPENQNELPTRCMQVKFLDHFSTCFI